MALSGIDCVYGLGKLSGYWLGLLRWYCGILSFWQEFGHIYAGVKGKTLMPSLINRLKLCTIAVIAT